MPAHLPRAAPDSWRSNQIRPLSDGSARPAGGVATADRASYLFTLLFNVLCGPTDLIWGKGTPFKAMTGCTAPSSDGLLGEVFWGFP